MPPEAKSATEELMRAVVLDRIENEEIVPEFLRQMVAPQSAAKKTEQRRRRDR